MWDKRDLGGKPMNTTEGASAGSTTIDPARGMALLRDPLLNKGTAFTEHERDALGLRGLLPAHVLSMEAQSKRVMTNLRRLPNDLDKIRRAQRTARSKRGAVLSRGGRTHR